MSEMAVATRLELQAALEAEDNRRTFNAIVVSDGHAWTALCRELGIASEGDTPSEAVANVKSAVREAQEVASERGIAAGQPVEDSALLEFIDTHTGPDPLTSFQFRL